MVIFGGLCMLIDFPCLAYAFLLPKLHKKEAMDAEQDQQHEDDVEKEEKLNAIQMAVYAHVASDLIWSISSVIAAIYILPRAPGHMYADMITSVVACITILFGVGGAVGIHECACELKEHYTACKDEEKTVIDRDETGKTNYENTIQDIYNSNSDRDIAQQIIHTEVLKRANTLLTSNKLKNTNQ